MQRLSPVMSYGAQALIVLLGLLLLGNSSHAQLAVQDDRGVVVQLESPAARIISLAPSLTEMLFEVGGGDRIVGTVEYSDYPAEATAIPVIGRFDRIDVEAIVAMQPDLVIAWDTGNPTDAVNQLTELGMTVYVAEPKTLASIASHLRRFATLVGEEALGNRRAQAFLQDYESLQARYNTSKPIPVFYQLWNAPIITAGGNELINDVITLCGGENIFADIPLMAPKVSKEAVLVREPQVIIASGLAEERPQWLDEWLAWDSLPAVQHNRLYSIPPAILQRHTTRVLQGAERMCEYIDSAR